MSMAKDIFMRMAAERRSGAERSARGEAGMSRLSDDELLKEAKDIIKMYCPASFAINLERDVNAGLKSPTFVHLICTLSLVIEERLGVEVQNSQSCPALLQHQRTGSTAAVLVMLSELLQTLGCPHSCLTQGGHLKGRLNSKRARILLMHYLCTKADSLERQKMPVLVDTMEKLQKVIESGESFIPIGEEIINSKLHKNFVAEIEADRKAVEKNEKEKMNAASKKVKEKLNGVHSKKMSRSETQTEVEENEREKRNAASKKKMEELFGSAKKMSIKKTQQSAREEAGKKVHEEITSVPVEKDARICWNCHGKENLSRCGGCKKAWYCGRKCQTVDRARHRRFCERAQHEQETARKATAKDEDKDIHNKEVD